MQANTPDLIPAAGWQSPTVIADRQGTKPLGAAHRQKDAGGLSMAECVANGLLGDAIKVEDLLWGVARQLFGKGKPDLRPTDKTCLTCKFSECGGEPGLDQTSRNQTMGKSAGTLHSVMQLRGQVVKVAVKFRACARDLLGEHIDHAGHAGKQLAQIVVQLLPNGGPLSLTDAQALSLEFLFARYDHQQSPGTGSETSRL